MPKKKKQRWKEKLIFNGILFLFEKHNQNELFPFFSDVWALVALG